MGEQEVLPGLGLEPGLLGQRPGAVRDVVDDTRLARRRLDEGTQSF
jgi:hypothetical protein